MLRDFLVFEATGDPQPAYTCFLTEHGDPKHVRAEDEVAAAKVVCGMTGRVRKYAVLEVAIIDLAARPHGDDIVTEVQNTPPR